MKSLQLSKPHFIVVIGIPGSGKTTFASRFAETFHAPFVNPRSFMEHLGDIAQTEAADTITDKLLDIVLPTHQTIIYESLSGTRVERAELGKRAREAGYEPLFIWVQTDTPVAEQRSTRGSRSRPAPMTSEEFDQHFKRFSPPHQSEKYLVISGMRTYASQVKPLLKRLAENARPAGAPHMPARPEPASADLRPSTSIVTRRNVKIM